MIKLELTQAVNNNLWDIWYNLHPNEDAILAAENIECNFGESIQLDIPANWVSIKAIPKGNPDGFGTWITGSI